MMLWFKKKDKTWKITRKSCKRRGLNLSDTLLQGVNLILLHNLVRDRGKVSNYFDSETDNAYKRWLEWEVHQLMKLLEEVTNEHR